MKHYVKRDGKRKREGERKRGGERMVGGGGGDKENGVKVRREGK